MEDNRICLCAIGGQGGRELAQGEITCYIDARAWVWIPRKPIKYERVVSATLEFLWQGEREAKTGESAEAR